MNRVHQHSMSQARFCKLRHLCPDSLYEPLFGWIGEKLGCPRAEVIPVLCHIAHPDQFPGRQVSGVTELLETEIPPSNRTQGEQFSNLLTVENPKVFREDADQGNVPMLKRDRFTLGFCAHTSLSSLWLCIWLHRFRSMTFLASF